MGNMPLIGPDAVQLIPLLIGAALIIAYMFWPQITSSLRWRRSGRRRALPRMRPRSSSAVRKQFKPYAETRAQRQKDRLPTDVSPTANETSQTRTAVEQLPPRVAWPLDQATLERLLVLYDGQNWRTLDATASRHMVICGASRSGKGNLLQILALTVLAQGPERAAVWALDPKGGLDYQELRRLAHARIYADVAEGDNPFDGDLSAGYQAALREMARRNRLLLDAGARNHREYRELTKTTLPILVLICDEVAELSSQQRTALCTLARMAAAAGIVIWAATQYPTAESLPTQVQANALDRLVFQFPSPRYTAVALGLAPGERPIYEPSAIGERGVAVLRQDGRDVCIGRVPLLTEPTSRAILRALRTRYPRVTAHSDAVTVPVTEAVTTPVTTPVTAPVTEQEALILGDIDGSARDVVTPAEQEQQRDDLVRALAREGLSVRKIRSRLAEQGMAIGQAPLLALIQEVRGEQVSVQTEPTPEGLLGVSAA